MDITDLGTILAQFNAWLEEANGTEPAYAEAMSLATASKDGMPSVRIVLLKAVSERGFDFYTNLTSRKGRELAENPNAALCFHWKSLDKQVRVEGSISAVSAPEADAYFASRPRASRIGAWASKQSQVMTDRFEFETRIAKYTAKFNVGDIPRPDFWSGFRLEPRRIEFWQEKKFRLHDRNVFVRDGDNWHQEKLYP
ncbi:MAG: pyridoxamine 5'-phosphate oxidase [Rhodospirillales bacterium]|nr:pyridoxamine 5'-phosphate oxidase [Rhodospirillales bacterium]